MSEPHDLTPEQQDIQRVCRDFAAREIRPVSLAIDEADTEVPWAVWHKAAELGLTSFMLPEQLGGAGMTDCATGCVVQEELSHGCAGIGNLITSGGFFAEPVLSLGSEDQQRRWVAPLAGEQPAAHRAGDDRARGGLGRRGDPHGRPPGRRRLRAQRAEGVDVERRGGGLLRRLRHGRARQPRPRGITAFVLERDDPGLAFGAPTRKMGQRAIRNCELFLEDVEVGEDRRLGEEGQGFRGLMETFDRSRVTLGASATGLARAALEYAVAYAGEREQFGRPIAEHQAVAFRLADMALRVDASRLLVGGRRACSTPAARPRPRRRWPSCTPRRPRCGAPGRRSRRSAAGATRASTRSRSGCATPSSRRSRRAPPTSSG